MSQTHREWNMGKRGGTRHDGRGVKRQRIPGRTRDENNPESGSDTEEEIKRSKGDLVVFQFRLGPVLFLWDKDVF